MFISSPAGIQGGHFLAHIYELSVLGGGWSLVGRSYTALQSAVKFTVLPHAEPSAMSEVVRRRGPARLEVR